MTTARLLCSGAPADRVSSGNGARLTRINADKKSLAGRRCKDLIELDLGSRASQVDLLDGVTAIDFLSFHGRL